MKPAPEALAYRIWALCQPRGWGMTLRDCAEELGENVNRVRSVAQHKGWATRFKSDVDTDGFMAARYGDRGVAWRDARADIRAVIQSVIGHSRRRAAE